jgi:hypothetical protein
MDRDVYMIDWSVDLGLSSNVIIYFMCVRGGGGTSASGR